jgi:hypothetical protein
MIVPALPLDLTDGDKFLPNNAPEVLGYSQTLEILHLGVAALQCTLLTTSFPEGVHNPLTGVLGSP